MVNFDRQAAEIVSLVWGTPANFNGFRVLAALLHGTLEWASAKLCGVEQRAPPIFGRAAITMGIGPHCGFSYHFVLVISITFIIVLVIVNYTTRSLSCAKFQWTGVGEPQNISKSVKFEVSRLSGPAGVTWSTDTDEIGCEKAHHRLTPNSPWSLNGFRHGSRKNLKYGLRGYSSSFATT